MVRARRARRRVSRIVLVSLALVMATAGASLAVWEVSGSAESVAVPSEAPVVTVSSQRAPAAPTATAPTSGVSAPARRRTTLSPAQGNASQTVAWGKVVSACQEKVRKRDVVIARAAVGIDHWTQHIQAQTDANAGRIPLATMKKIFAKTRVAGPSDQRRYRDALKAASQASGKCSATKGAPTQVQAALRNCSARMAAQNPVLGAASRGMADWDSHLGDMRRSRHGHIHNAQEIWMETWRAAPPDIKSFHVATRSFERAAKC
jgi:hypothetical protein